MTPAYINLKMKSKLPLFTALIHVSGLIVQNSSPYMQEILTKKKWFFKELFTESFFDEPKNGC